MGHGRSIPLMFVAMLQMAKRRVDRQSANQVSGDGYLAFQSSQRQLFNKRRDPLGSSNTGKGTILGLREGEIDSCGTGLIGLPVGLLIGFPGVEHGHTLGV